MKNRKDLKQNDGINVGDNIILLEGFSNHMEFTVVGFEYTEVEERSEIYEKISLLSPGGKKVTYITGYHSTLTNTFKPAQIKFLKPGVYITDKRILLIFSKNNENKYKKHYHTHMNNMGSYAPIDFIVNELLLKDSRITDIGILQARKNCLVTVQINNTFYQSFIECDVNIVSGKIIELKHIGNG